jgi:hypothetical protein
MAAERDSLIDAITSVIDWRKALDVHKNTAYKHDAMLKVDAARMDMDKKMQAAHTIIDKYRR